MDNIQLEREIEDLKKRVKELESAVENLQGDIDVIADGGIPDNFP